MEDIPRQQVLWRIRSENTWWSPPHQISEPDAKLGARAYLASFVALVKLLEVRRAILLMGPRRVGKTVLLRHLVRQLLKDGVAASRICYLSVDHPLYNGLGLEQLLLAYCEAANVNERDGPLYVLYDEIQHLRDWEVHLKTLVDGHPSVRFVASGSAAAALRLKSRESGAGRFTDFLLPPLTFHEYVTLRGTRGSLFNGDGLADSARADEEFTSYLNFGGYPELALNPEAQRDPGRFVKEDVIDKVLLRDLPSLYGIQDVQELNSLFTTLAFNSGSEVSLEKLSQRSHVAKNTLKRYIDYLEAAFLIKVVHRIDQTARRFQRASAFKVYLTNPAMFAALFTPVSADDPVTSRLVETAVFAQWFHISRPVYYARWDRGEVDLVWLDRLQAPSEVTEVKWTDRAFADAAEIRPLLAFCRKHALPRATVTTRGALGQRVFDEVSVSFVPASLYCYIVGNVIVNSQTETVHAAVRKWITAPPHEQQAFLTI